MDCKDQNSFLPLQVENLSCCKLASALAKLCQFLQLYSFTAQICNFHDSKSQYFLVQVEVDNGSFSNWWSQPLCYVLKPQLSVICATGNVKEKVKEFPAHLSAQKAQLSAGKGSYWTLLHQTFLLNSKSCEGKELKTTALASRNSSSSMRLCYIEQIKLWGKIRGQNTLKKMFLFFSVL